MPQIMTNLHTKSHNLRNTGFCPDSPGKKARRFSSLGRTQSHRTLRLARARVDAASGSPREPASSVDAQARAPLACPPSAPSAPQPARPLPAERARVSLLRFKRVVARYGPAYPAAAARSAGRAPAPGHAAPRRAHAVDRGCGQPGEGPPERRPRRRVRRLEVPPHGVSRLFQKHARDTSTRERRLTEPSRRPAPQELDRKRSSSTLSLDLIHQLVQLLPRQYKRCAIRPRRVRHARLRLPPERTLTSAPVASRRPALLPPRQV